MTGTAAIPSVPSVADLDDVRTRLGQALAALTDVEYSLALINRTCEDDDRVLAGIDDAAIGRLYGLLADTKIDVEYLVDKVKEFDDQLAGLHGNLRDLTQRRRNAS